MHFSSPPKVTWIKISHSQKTISRKNSCRSITNAITPFVELPKLTGENEVIGNDDTLNDTKTRNSIFDTVGTLKGCRFLTANRFSLVVVVDFESLPRHTYEITHTQTMVLSLLFELMFKFELVRSVSLCQYHFRLL